MNADDAAVHKRFVDLFIAQDEALVECLHPDLVVHEPDGLPYGGEYHGPEGFLELAGKLRAAFDVDVHGGKIHQAEDQIIGVMELTFTGRNGEGSFDMPVLEKYSFRDGLISEIDVYYKDTKLVADLLGAPAEA